jgi:hypothetical protein
MPKGLRITYDDGGPAMEITAGLRCPSFCQNVSEAWDVNQYTINQRVDGSQIVLSRAIRFTNLTGVQTSFPPSACWMDLPYQVIPSP